ncbi:hypothetical protein ACFLRY_04005 [Bacteroidota bacterium]
MKKLVITMFLLSIFGVASSQDNQTEVNAAGLLSSKNEKLTIGGYAQIDYNQPIKQGQILNGKLDVHRMVMLFGYKFNDRIQFITEIELEHVKEIFVEQAFVSYKINSWLNLRGGLMLVPFGIINEYHEPPSFNGVERPSVDKYIVPTTWREIGIGFAGNILKSGLKYQLYLMNGFVSYNGSGTLDGKNGLRKGRQKGAESIISSPNVAARLEYYKFSGLTLGVSGYFGKTQSTLFKDVEKENAIDKSTADSSIVGISMFGADIRYNIKGIMLRGQITYGKFSNTADYNSFTGNDFGSSMIGYYIEAAYDVFKNCKKVNSQLIPFIRYENYNTQNTVSGGITKNAAYHREEITAGLGWKPVSGVAFKADYQLFRFKGENIFAQQFNAGIGIWF